MVYSLGKPHEVGSICGNPCKQCGGDTVAVTDPKGTPVPDPPPFFIIREANYEEYLAEVLSAGGDPVSPDSGRYCYVVTSD